MQFNYCTKFVCNLHFLGWTASPVCDTDRTSLSLSLSLLIASEPLTADLAGLTLCLSNFLLLESHSVLISVLLSITDGNFGAKSFTSSPKTPCLFFAAFLPPLLSVEGGAAGFITSPVGQVISSGLVIICTPISMSVSETIAAVTSKHLICFRRTNFSLTRSNKSICSWSLISRAWRLNSTVPTIILLHNLDMLQWVFNRYIISTLQSYVQTLLCAKLIIKCHHMFLASHKI